MLDELGARGMLQLLVEGGAKVAHAFHDDGVVDRYVLYLAPALFGGDDAVPMFAGPARRPWRGSGGAGSSRSPDWETTSASNWQAGLSDVEIARVEEAIAAIGRGEIVVVVDDEDRENEGDLIMAAEAATPEKIAFFLAHTSGVICVPLTAERADAARAASDGHGQHRVAAHRLHGVASTTATAPRRASRPRTGPRPSRP